MKPRALQACEAQMPLDVDQNNHTAMQLPQEAKRKLQRSSERATSSSNENIMDLWQTIAGSTTSNSIEQTSSVAPFRSRHQEKALSSGVVVAVYTHPTKENDDKTRFLRDRCDRPQKVCAMGLVTDTNHLKERPFKGRDAEDRAVLMQFSGNYGENFPLPSMSSRVLKHLNLQIACKPGFQRRQTAWQGSRHKMGAARMSRLCIFSRSSLSLICLLSRCVA